MNYQCLNRSTREYVLSIRSNVKLEEGQVINHPENGEKYRVVSTEPIDHRMPEENWYAWLEQVDD